MTEEERINLQVKLVIRNVLISDLRLKLAFLETLDLEILGLQGRKPYPQFMLKSTDALGKVTVY